MFEKRFVTTGHDNNLNLIRATAATAVMVSHAWPLTFGRGTPEPFQAFLGHSLGSLSVFIFFAISGFLISASFVRSGSVARFVSARGLRLFPGLFVSLVLVAFVMGPLVTSLPLADYLGHLRVWRFMLANMVLISPQHTLPGVFETNPYPSVEGSIWTLPFEVAWYGVVLLAGIAGLLERRWAMLALVVGVVVLWLLVQVGWVHVHPRLGTLITMGVPFSMGMAMWAWRAQVPQSGWILVALLVPGLSVAAVPLLYPLFILLVVYATFWCAYVPGGVIRSYNRVGDYSYGIYIYAFPVQGLVFWLWPVKSVPMQLAIAFPVTLVLAILSWHLVEGPAMRVLRRGRATVSAPAPVANAQIRP